MDQRQPFSFRARLQSIRHAIHGMALILRTEHNARVHLAATAIVAAAGLALDVGRSDWIGLIVAIALVWAAEALNTAFELLCDVTSPDFHPVVKQAKDVAAGAVLASALAAVAIGAVVFLPHL